MAVAVAAALVLGTLALSAPDASAAPPPVFAVTSPANNATVPSRTVTLAGTGTPGSTVSVLDAGGSPVPGTNPAVVGANRAWTTTGTYTAAAPATEHLTASQVTGGSASGSASLLIHLPARPSQVFAVTGPANNATVPSRTVTFTGTGTPRSTVTVLDAHGTPVPGTTPAVVGQNSTWTTTGTFPATAAAAEHLTASQATGGAANGSASLLINLPALTYPFAVTSPANGSTVPSRTVTFTGTGTPGSTVDLFEGATKLAGTNPVAVGSNGIWSVAATFASTAPVSQHLVANQVTKGSANGTASVAVQLPATHPFAVSSPADNSTVASRTVTFTGSGTPGSTVSVLDAGGARVPGTTPVVVAANGIWTITRTFAASAPVTESLVATQVTGGSPDGSVAITIHLPAAPPTAPPTAPPATPPTAAPTTPPAPIQPFTVTSPTDNSTVPARTVTFTGTGTTGSTVNILDAGGTRVPGTTSTAVGAGGTWTTTGTFAAAAPVTEQLAASQVTNGANSGTIHFTIHLPSAPAITVAMSADPSSFGAPSQAITYRYLVTNTGNVTLTSIGLADSLVPPAAIRCPTPSLAPGADETCTGTYTTTQTNVDAASILSASTATGTPPTGAAVTSPQATLTVPGPPNAPAITVATSVSRPSFTAPGQAIAYRYVVTNTGNVTLTSIGVADSKVPPTPLRCPASTLAPRAHETCIGTYTTTVADVFAHSVTSWAVAQGLPPHTATPVRSGPSITRVPLAVSPIRHLTAVAHKAPISPAKPKVTG